MAAIDTAALSYVLAAVDLATESSAKQQMLKVGQSAVEGGGFEPAGLRKAAAFSVAHGMCHNYGGASVAMILKNHQRGPACRSMSACVSLAVSR